MYIEMSLPPGRRLIIEFTICHLYQYILYRDLLIQVQTRSAPKKPAARGPWTSADCFSQASPGRGQD